MEKLHNIFKMLPEYDVSPQLHKRILRKVLFRHFTFSPLTILSLLLLNLGLSGWQVWSRLIETETLSILKALFEGFEWSSFFLRELFSTITESVPLFSLSVFLLNAVLVISFIRISYKWDKTSVW